MIEVEGPEGQIFEFPEGTSQEVMRGALQKYFGPQTQETPTLQQEPVRGSNGELMGPALGEVVQTDGGNFFKDQNGGLIAINPGTDAVLRDTSTGKIMAFEKLAASNEADTGTILPIKRNSAGELSPAIPKIISSAAEALASAVTLPGDVFTGKTQMRDPNTGEIPDEVIGRSLELATIGSPVSAGSKRIAPALTKSQAVSKTAQDNVDEAGEFGVDLTRGQASREFKDQTFEGDAITGGKGQGAQAVLARQREAQETQVDAAVKDLKDSVSPSTTNDAFEAAENVGSAVSQRAADLKRESQAAFTRAENSGAQIAPEAAGSLAARARVVLNEVGALRGQKVAPQLPATERALSQIDDLAALVKSSDGKVVSVNWQAFERVRRNINKSNVGGDDGFFVGKIKGSIDEWLKDTIDKGLVDGSPEFLKDVKSGRALWSQYMKIAKSPTKIIRNMVKNNVDSVQIANWLYGASKVGGRADSAAVAREIKGILGSDNAAVDDLRRGVMIRLFEDARSGETKTFGKLAGDIREFTTGSGRELAKALYGEDGVRRLQRFSTVLKGLTPDSLAINPSRSGQTILRRATDAMTKAAPLVGFAADGMTGLLAGFGFSAAGKGLARRKAIEAVQRPVPKSRNALLPTVNNLLARSLVAGSSGQSQQNALSRIR